jgi:hypothetical protein
MCADALDITDFKTFTLYSLVAAVNSDRDIFEEVIPLWLTN